jgi:hypothetical protein
MYVYPFTFFLHRRAHTCKGLHQSTARRAITNLEMPAMSPTMTEGGITSWKKKEGESFSTGEVLLEIVRVTPCSSSSVLLPVSGNGQGNDRRRGTRGRRPGQDLGASVET